MFKDQALCYRTINGVRWRNWCDMTEDRYHDDVISCKKAGLRIRKIKHPDGYYQAFIHPDDEEAAGDLMRLSNKGA